VSILFNSSETILQDLLSTDTLVVPELTYEAGWLSSRSSSSMPTLGA
jgi:hypothetical protein